MTSSPDGAGGIRKRDLLKGAAALGLAATILGLDTANAGEIEPQALEYLKKRGFNVRKGGAVLEILDKDGHLARIATTPRLANSGMNRLRDHTSFHTIELKNPEKCKPFLVAQLGALRQILIVPTDGVSEIKRTGVYHRFFYEESLGLVGILGHAHSGFTHRIDEETGTETRITDPAALEKLRGINFSDEGSLKNMPSANCQLIS